MKATLVLPLAVFSTLVFFYIRETDAIKCYVCQDCAESYVSEHLQNCSRTVDKCIKMVLMSGEVDRLCADKNDKHKCTGRGNGRSKRSIEDEIDDCLPKRRIIRQLLGGDGGGSSSSGNKGKDKTKDKQKEEKKGVKEAAEVYCCADDGCNGAIRLSVLSCWPLLLISLLTPVLFSNICNSFQYFRYVN